MTSLHVVSWFVYLQPRFTSTSTRDVATDSCCLLLSSAVFNVNIWIWIIWGVMVQQCLTWTGLVCVFNWTSSLGCVVTRTECSSSRSGFYWFIYHWATVEDDPELQTFGLWAWLLSLLRAPLTFLTHRPGSSSEGVSVTPVSVLSVGTDEINGVQSGGLRPDHLLCRWSICARCSGCFWPFLNLRVWKKSELTHCWQSHLRVWSLSMRRQEHLSGDNETVSPEESGPSVTVSCLYHLYLSDAGTASLLTRLNY